MTITLKPGKRGEMIELLRSSAAGMPGRQSYMVGEDPKDADVLWVTELWESEDSHNTSLLLPALRSAVPEAKSLVANFEQIAVTNPLWAQANTVVF